MSDKASEFVGIFDQAIRSLEAEGLSYSEPQSFCAYRDSLEKKPTNSTKNTAQILSVQKKEDLQRELVESGYMIFRLGKREGQKGSYFGLAKLKNPDDWSEYFLIDADLFKGVEKQIFLPNVSIRQLFAFNLLSDLTENSLINLAISSGLMASALGIETSESLAAPASASGTFNFQFKANCDENAPVWDHEQGQVEIDALFVGRRGKQEILFVIEAKTSEKYQSLAKHKLVYPILALRNKIPDCIQVIPVYLRVVKSKNNREIDFYVAECKPINIQEVVSVSTLEVRKPCKHYVLFGFNEQ